MLASRQQAGACFSGRAPTQPSRSIPRLRPSVVVRAESTGTNFGQAFEDAKDKAARWAKQQKIEEKATDFAREVQDQARRTFVKLDSEYDISSKMNKGARKVEEAARDIDQEYGVRRRLRSVRDYLARNWPSWKRQVTEFAATPAGKVSVFVLACLAFSTPAFWSLLNLLLLLWWLSIPLSLMALNYARSKQEEAARLAQEEEMRRAATNPFADLFRSAASGARAASSAARTAGRGGGGGGRAARTEGPIIEAEWTPIVEDDDADRAKRGSRR
ncbi:hypothetical protein HYH03_014855 [Edaphochlamys debaryana]|uniref:Uncharacterized protein n=1 Tax=Edaphochlamys debaryana TaxID=47281 RepID=A0A835XN32_9CHLO|nr:hypothetical protein HYH03_014855 [Edaphochlamys debaryana]|eukprot:KAG2486554.1 hypothetical protein HYH03_014855 [Edaphochlamys debaryana]